MDLKRRICKEHMSQLKRDIHGNPVLQTAWNNHAEKEGFVWWLLAPCDPLDTLVEEQKALDLYRPFVDEFRGFNISHDARNPMQGQKHKRESVDRTIANGIQTRLGNRVLKVIDPMGTIHELRNMSQFERDHGLPKSTLSWLLTGRKKHAKGWRAFSEAEAGKPFDTTPGNCKAFALVDPTGKRVVGRGVERFCKEHGVNLGDIIDMLKGRRDQIKGWRRDEPCNLGVSFDPDSDKPERTLVSPKGQVVRFRNVTDFSEAHGLNRSSVFGLIHGQLKTLKGWRHP